MIMKGKKVSIAPIERLYTSHVMLAYTDRAPDLQVWMQSMKNSGYNLFWAYQDNYYQSSTLNFLNAAQAKGVKVLVGMQGGTPVGDIVQMMQETWDHPAIYRFNGKRVYGDYDHQPESYADVVTALAAVGIQRSGYLLWGMSHYPVNATWIAPDAWIEGFFGFPNINVNQVDHLYSAYPNLDWLINFAVDKGSSGTDEVVVPDTSLSNAIIENNFISDSSKRIGRNAMAGINCFYSSVQFTDFGFKGTAAIWQAIIDLAVASRPLAVNDTTANDYAELSYMSPTLTTMSSGLAHIPVVSEGFFDGDNTREVLTDHSGVQKFLRPWVDAFLSDSLTVTFPTERIFSWYWLHPSNAALIPTIPAAVTALNSTANGNKYTQGWWDWTVWAIGSSQVTEMKNHITKMDTIRMAAHLTSSGYLKINSTLSTLQSAGAAYFEIPVSSFRGTPTFSIIAANGTTVRKTGNGLQPISDSCYPGGWNFLATEN